MFDPEFFPTPPAIAARMLEKLDKGARFFLDPSAGNGNIADTISGRDDYGRFRGRRDVDCIEHSPELVSILNGKGYPVVGLASRLEIPDGQFPS